MFLKPFKIFCFLIFVLTLFPGCGGDSGITGNRWTVLVYMAADNDLKTAANLDLLEMITVGSTDNVTVVVQYDTRDDPTRRYLVERDKMTPFEELGELNMADPITLRDFIASGVNKFPAEHYALIVWDHGNGWQTGVDKRVTSLVEDWNNGTAKTLPMTNRQVADGILAAEAITGKHLDIMGIDACIMATIEAAYEFRNAADNLVASQDLVQGFGWDYRDLLARLTANPLMSPRELASAMVASYRQFAESAAWGYGDQTISAVSLGSGIEKLARELDAVAKTLKGQMEDPLSRDATVEGITAASTAAQRFQPATYVDLQDFALKLDPVTSTASLRAALTAVIIDSYHGSKRPGANGMNIVFIDLPAAVNFSVYDFDYTDTTPITGRPTQTAFIRDYSWDEMMNTYFALNFPNLIK